MWNGLSSPLNDVRCTGSRTRRTWGPAHDSFLAGGGVPDVKVERPQRSEDERP